MTAQLPTPQQRADVEARLQDVMDAIKQHPLWKDGADRNPTLYYVWDFVKNSKDKLRDYENVKAGRPLQYPQIYGSRVGTGDTAALKVFQDVCSRTMMLDMLANDKSGKTAMMTGVGGPTVDFGDAVRDAVSALDDVCPDEHVMAGMMA